jgi:Nif-specific regulatory protein
MQTARLTRIDPRARRTDVALYGVYEISKLLTSPTRIEVTLGKVMHLLASFLDMRHGLIALLGNDKGPEMVVGSGWSEDTARRYFDQLPEQAIGRIVVTEMPLVVENMREDPLFERFDFSAWGVGEDISFVGVPIKEAGKVIGTLTIDADVRTHDGFGFDEDVRFLTMVANLVGQTVRLHRLIARDRERLMEERRRLERELEGSEHDRAELRRGGIVGDSPALRGVLDKVRVVARSNSTVLLRGESGTGKELFARALHDLSSRKDKAFVKVNCAALPESVLESELFGHEKGAFTGAAALRKGRFELADGGTLFLDEIGEISASFQAKLLRVLQEGEFERVGGTTTLKVDVRLVTATNRNLEEAVSAGEFRADLYYRISVVPIFLPPLRDRQTDIPVLAEEFLRRFNSEHSTSLNLAEDALAVLTACQFPGNVRELENCVRRTATLAASCSIHASDFACHKDECLSAALWTEPPGSPPHFVPLPIGRGPRPLPTAPIGASPSASDEDLPLGPDSRAVRERLIGAMESSGWVQAKAARLLGISPRQLGYALRKHEIAIKKF